MRSNKQFYTSKGSNQVGLYSFVFTRRISIFAIVFLFVSFLIQPFHLALANEAAAEEVAEEIIPDEIIEQLPSLPDTEKETEIIDEEPTSPEETKTEETDTVSTTDIATDSEEEIIEETNNESEVNEETASSTDENVDDEETEVGNDNASSTDSTSDNTASSTDNTASSTDNTASSTGLTGDDTASSTDDTATSTDNTNDDTNASSTDSGTDNDDTGNTNDDSNDQTDDIQDGEGGGGSADDTSSTTDDLIDNQTIQDGLSDLVDEVVDDVVALTRQLVTEENYYQFSRQSCVAVGGGTYHCTVNEDQSIDPDSAVYAEQDEGGDMEIFMRTSKGDIKQLTDNDYDDTSPDVDLTSMRVVWQRLIDGRYQIISYDLETREETQLTFSKNNRMEPKVAKEGIVWQAWDGNDWEIVFFDGQYTEQITTNDIQDVAPVIEEGYILWNVLGGDESEARVYTIENGEIRTITGQDGGTVANPRFVLVYDTKFDNGDIITQGFDPVTGLAQPLAAKPAELPFDIPEPDPVGEIRALINNKSTQNEKDIVATPLGDDTNALNLASTTATSTDTLSLDNPDTDGDNSVELPASDEDFELEEYDLVITDRASSTEATVNENTNISNLAENDPITTATSTQP